MKSFISLATLLSATLIASAALAQTPPEDKIDLKKQQEYLHKDQSNLKKDQAKVDHERTKRDELAKAGNSKGAQFYQHQMDVDGAHVKTDEDNIKRDEAKLHRDEQAAH